MQCIFTPSGQYKFQIFKDKTVEKGEVDIQSSAELHSCKIAEIFRLRSLPLYTRLPRHRARFAYEASNQETRNVAVGTCEGRPMQAVAQAKRELYGRQ